MYSASFAVAAFAVFGGYLVFSIAFNVKSSMLNNIGKKVDLSYGVYLYAWPVQKVLIWWRGDLSPWVVFLGSTIIAALFALMSWRLVEKPFLDLKSAFVFPRKASCKEASAMPGD
jgi:peptidoglycan/LPS O-acetylase OafA/YrhL